MFLLSFLYLSLCRSPKSSDSEATEVRPRFQTTTYLQLPSPTAHLSRQRSQPIQPVPAGTCVLPVSSSSTSPTPPTTLNFITPNNIPIPTLALTPVSSTSNIVIEQYPTILRVVSIEEVNNLNTEAQASPCPPLSRSQSQLGKKHFHGVIVSIEF